jgi:predicted O-linked N-acetylglucosamine transferase (SPINDLY family)
MKLTVSEALERGVQAQQDGRVQDADRFFTAVLKAQPDHPGANYNMGLLAISVGQAAKSLPFLAAAAKASPGSVEYWATYIRQLLDSGRTKAAKIEFDKARQAIGESDVLNQLEISFPELKTSETLSGSTSSASSVLSTNVLQGKKLSAALRLAEKKTKEGNYIEARKIYSDVLEVFPQNKAALQGRHKLDSEASGSPDAPGQEQLHQIISLYQAGQIEESLTAAERLRVEYPRSHDIYNILGAIKEGISDTEGAISCYKIALEINPGHAPALNNLGAAFRKTGDYERAVSSYERALELKPGYTEAFYNMGNAFKEEGRFEQAIANYRKAIHFKPDFVESYVNLANSLFEIGDLDQALATCKKALEVRPDYANCHHNMGTILQHENRLEESIESYEKALQINPGIQAARVEKLYVQALICDWAAMQDDLKLVPDLGIDSDQVNCLSILVLEDVPERHRLRSEVFARQEFRLKAPELKYERSVESRKLRIGYFSGDYRDHPVAHLMAKVFEIHDRDSFEIYGYAFGPPSNDEMRNRLANAFDIFRDVQRLTDREIADLSRSDKIDIAIDLGGYTRHNRAGIFSYRAAPIQINYLGYPGTMGVDFIDYIIADRNLIPESSQQFYSEKPIYLPHQYLATNNSQEIYGGPINKAEMGLPDEGFIFCAAHNPYKIGPREFDIWMRLLEKVGGSVLWLLERNRKSKENLLKEAELRGINPERLVFPKLVSYEKHLAQFQCADLFLDTFTYNAGSTAINALWAGLPVLTKQGRGYAARMSGSFLNAIGLADLITETEKAYEQRALELATDPTQLAAINTQLASNKHSEPLFDTELFTRNLESAYRQAYQQLRAGGEPETIYVS